VGVPDVQCQRAGERKPYYARMRSRSARPVARERNPATPHVQECVPDVQRRSRRSATLPATRAGTGFPPNDVQRGSLQHLPTEGIEPTHCCQYWILSPARLPIPPRRLFARRQLLILLQRNASVNDASPQLLSRRTSREDRSQESGVAGVQDLQNETTAFRSATVLL
jgi:hypothetical protein